MSNDLRAALRKEADRLADEFYEKAMSLISSEVSGMFGGPKAKAPAPKSAPKTVTATDTENVLAVVIETLKKHTDGLRSEGLQKETGISKDELTKAFTLGLESHQLTKTGQKRATTYRLPGRKKGR